MKHYKEYIFFPMYLDKIKEVREQTPVVGITLSPSLLPPSCLLPLSCMLPLPAQKVETHRYQTTRQFLHDTEWILHNCIIYNGGKWKGGRGREEEGREEGRKIMILQCLLYLSS